MTCTIDFETAGRDFYTLKEIDEGGKWDIINGTLARSGKQLSKPVIDKMLTLSASDNPLYLSLLVQRLTMMNREDFAEIKNKGDGMSAIEQHQIELIEKKCPDNLEEMSAELLLEAGRRINPELVSKAGQYIAVSRAGLRKKDLSALLGETWTDIDFSHFISYMNDCFMLRDDGRYDFIHKSIREGFLKKCDSEKINLEILSHLKTLPEDDSVRIAEVIYHAIKADDKRFFVCYIIVHQFDENESYINQASLDIRKKCLEDDCAWIFKLMDEIYLWEINESLSNFIFFIILSLNIDLDFLEKVISLAEYVNSNFNSVKTREALSLCYYYKSESYLKDPYKKVTVDTFGGYRKALIELKDLLKHDLLDEIGIRLYSLILIPYDWTLCNYYPEMKDNKKLSELAEFYEAILYKKEKDINFHSRLAEIYEELNELEDAVCYYNKCISLSNDKALVEYYCKVAKIYKKIGGHDCLYNALEYYNKAKEIAEEYFLTNISIEEINYIYFDVADIYLELGGNDNIQKAIWIYEGLIQSDEKSKNDKLLLYYTNFAAALLKLGDDESFNKASFLYDKSMDIVELMLLDKVEIALVKFYLFEIFSKIKNLSMFKGILKRISNISEILYKKFPNRQNELLTEFFENELNKMSE